ncbi:hypothetical protein [Streptomyces sp. NPDC021224]|uniref:hypothetical protein n=1 Tax=unclassified Streptomyces TaxID=2593676 RepID=UPI00378F54C8
MTEPGETEAATGAGSTGAAGTGADPGAAGTPAARRARKQVLLRLDPAVHDAVAAWAATELRSTNAQIEFLLRRALGDAGRLPTGARPIPRRGRPSRAASAEDPPAPA